MSTGRIRVGAIGCGGHPSANLHPCLAIMDAFDFACVCDLDAARAERSAARFGLQRWYTDWREMLEREALDAVVVAAPPAVHEEVGLEALRRGLHLFSEKPTSMTSAGAKRLVEAARGKPLRQMVGLMYRHAPAHRLARELMEREEFGRPLLFQAHYLAPGPGFRRDWGLTEAQRQRYFLLDHVIHIIDCARYFMGEITRVDAAAVPSDFEREAYQVTLTFDSGAVGNLMLAHRAPSYDAFVCVLGDGPAMVQVRNWQTVEYSPPRPWAGRGGYTDHPAMTWDSGITYNDGVSRPGYKEELEQFARAILQDEPCHADLEDGWKAMLVLDAIEESLQEGKPAAVPAT